MAEGINQEMLDNLMKGKVDYYKEFRFGSFSGLKVFAKCETLFRDIFVDKTYEEPEREYFVYGKLVDALISESAQYLKDNFVLVERRVNPEDALVIENKIIALKKYLDAPEFKEKLAKGNKVSQKGYEKRIKEIGEFEDQLALIKEYADKQQVTKAVWENAEETALALKTHPIFTTMEFNEMTAQQTFATTFDGIPVKGKLDHLKLSPEMAKIYATWKANQITGQEMRMKIAKLHDDDKWGIITDIKTCFSFTKLEPFNKHYRGQLKFYQMLVASVLGIDHTRIACRIFVADKTNNHFKISEVFAYRQEDLDERWTAITTVLSAWYTATTTKVFTSDKAKFGIKQECFTCTECRFSPFASKLGEPVLLTGPRFEKSEQDVFSTAEAVLEY